MFMSTASLISLSITRLALTTSCYKTSISISGIDSNCHQRAKRRWTSEAKVVGLGFSSVEGIKEVALLDQF